MKNNSQIARKNILSKLRKIPIEFEESKQNFSGIVRKDYTNVIKVEKFKTNIEASRAEVHSCTKNNWCNILISVVKEKKIKKMIYGKKTDFGEKIFKEFKNKLNLVNVLVDYNKPVEKIKDLLFGVDASITNSIGGIAETGSLILCPSPEEPRLMSLIPAIHIALLYEDTIHNNLLEAINKEKWDKKMPTNFLLISGPSKTADIEQTLVYGAHGCKQLIVLIIK